MARASEAHAARVERIARSGRERIVRGGVGSHADPEPARDASTKCAISA
jgi:hypothetical protein